MYNILRREMSDGTVLIVEPRWSDAGQHGTFVYKTVIGRPEPLLVSLEEYKQAALWLLAMPEMQEACDEHA